MEDIVKITEKEYLRQGEKTPWASGKMHATVDGHKVNYEYYSDGSVLRINFSFGGFHYYKDYEGDVKNSMGIYLKAERLIESIIGQQ